MIWKDPNPFNSIDPNDRRLSSYIKDLDLGLTNADSEQQNNSKTPGLLSYGDDLGIVINKGRLGAHLAPNYIRKYLYRMTPWHNDTTNSLDSILLYDYGTTSIQNKISPLNSTPEELQNLINENHKSAQARAAQILPKGPLITIGGGHDYGYCDGSAFLDNFKNEHHKPVIINFDAHLDVRPNNWGNSSGTPFYRLLTEYKNQFEFIEWGIQAQCNQPSHREWAESQGATIVTLDTIRMTDSLSLLKSVIKNSSRTQKCFISLDIDVFSQSLAPGCSQSWDGGLTYAEITPVIDWLIENKEVHLFSIYEVSPPLDFDDRTSKLAAQLIYNYLKKLSSKLAKKN